MIKLRTAQGAVTPPEFPYPEAKFELKKEQSTRREQLAAVDDLRRQPLLRR